MRRRVTRIFGGDDIALKGRQSTAGRGILEYAAFTIRNLPSTEPLPLRLRRLVRIGLTGMREHHLVEQLRCERGAAIARKAGFSDRVGEAIHDLHEHWDGKGQPRGLSRDRITAGPDPRCMPGPGRLPGDPRPGRRDSRPA